jgi:hypothetical protein
MAAVVRFLDLADVGMIFRPGKHDGLSEKHFPLAWTGRPLVLTMPFGIDSQAIQHY